MVLEKIPRFSEVQEWAQNQGWITASEAPVQSVNGEVGDVNINDVVNSDTEPENQNVIWIDTSGDQSQAKIYNPGEDEWQSVGVVEYNELSNKPQKTAGDVAFDFSEPTVETPLGMQLYTDTVAQNITNNSPSWPYNLSISLSDGEKNAVVDYYRLYFRLEWNASENSVNDSFIDVSLTDFTGFDSERLGFDLSDVDIVGDPGNGGQLVEEYTFDSNVDAEILNNTVENEISFIFDGDSGGDSSDSNTSTNFKVELEVNYTSNNFPHYHTIVQTEVQ